MTAHGPKFLKGPLVPECRGRPLTGIFSMVKEAGRSHGFLKTFLKVTVGVALPARKHLKALNICPVSLWRLRGCCKQHRFCLCCFMSELLEEKGAWCLGRAGEPSQGGNGGWRKLRCRGWRSGNELAE